MNHYADKILALDAGNTNITFAKFSADQIVARGNIRTVKDADCKFFEQQFMELSLFADLEMVAIASVVPEMDRQLESFIGNVNPDAKICWISYRNCKGLKFGIAEPETVGADRIANAVAARDLYGQPPVLVVDVGTATSFDFVAADGSFAGGVIMPGPKISFDALRDKASKLKDITLDWPRNVIGRNTAEAINSGVHFGHLYAVEGLVAAAKREVPELKTVVVTGGAGNLLLEHSEWFSVYDPDLTLKGIRIIAGDLSG